VANTNATTRFNTELSNVRILSRWVERWGCMSVALTILLPVVLLWVHAIFDFLYIVQDYYNR